MSTQVEKNERENGKRKWKEKMEREKREKKGEREK